jgi:hypothetical protein
MNHLGLQQGFVRISKKELVATSALFGFIISHTFIFTIDDSFIQDI